MKRFSPTKIVGFVSFLIILVFLLTLIFINQIKSEIISLVSYYGYPAIFVITILIEVTVQPIGPELSIATGRLINLPMHYVAITVILATIIGSFIDFKIGSIFYPKVKNDKSCEKYCLMYKKYGKFGLLVAALGPVPYVPFCWFSGAFGLSIRNFFLYGIFPRILRIIFVSFTIPLLF